MRTMVVAQHADAANQLSRRIGILRYGLVAILLILSFTLWAETFTAQGFEAGASDTWNYTANPPDMSRIALWGRTDQPFSGANAQAGSWYWMSWDLNNIESSLTFDTVNLPIYYVYSISFYYFTNGINPSTEFCKYSVAYDSGSVWSDWTTLSPDTDAWTLVTIPIPAYASNVRLKVATSHDGTGKYAHWDSFCINRSPLPPSAPVVYNTNVAQRTDGSGLVDIYYDLFDANGDNSTISLLLSDNAGTSYSITPNSPNLSGDVGAGILPESRKHIVWNAAAEIADFDTNQYKLRIVAEDNTYPSVAIPVFTPGSGSYTAQQTVTISCATTDATIRYTINGTEPTESSSVYSTPLIVSANTTLKAKAFKALCSASLTATASYIFDLSQTLLCYWNFNYGAPATDQTWAQPIPATVGNAQLIYTFTDAFSFGGTLFNGVYGEVVGGSFCPRGGLDNVNNGEYFTMMASTLGYDSISLSYPTRKTSTGFSTQEIQYTLDGTNWISKETVSLTGFENNWVATQMVNVDFSSIAGAANNANFGIRVVLDGAGSATGNNRIDNIRISGIPFK